jgi:hypothetical protein
VAHDEVAVSVGQLRSKFCSASTADSGTYQASPRASAAFSSCQTILTTPSTDSHQRRAANAASAHQHVIHVGYVREEACWGRPAPAAADCDGLLQLAAAAAATPATNSPSASATAPSRLSVVAPTAPIHQTAQQQQQQQQPSPNRPQLISAVQQPPVAGHPAPSVTAVLVQDNGAAGSISQSSSSRRSGGFSRRPAAALLQQARAAAGRRLAAWGARVKRGKGAAGTEGSVSGSNEHLLGFTGGAAGMAFNHSTQVCQLTLFIVSKCYWAVCNAHPVLTLLDGVYVC